VGLGLLLHSHGLRDRQIRGPPEVGTSPRVIVLRLRRYRCRGCRSVITVGPRGLVRRHLFSAGAIAVALALWSIMEQAAVEVRRQISPFPARGFDSVLGWAHLRRWIRAVRNRRLFGDVRAAPSGWTARQVAARVAMTVASLGPRSSAEAPLLERVFTGAAHAA
jgi:hypothetical protein